MSNRGVLQTAGVCAAMLLLAAGCESNEEKIAAAKAKAAGAPPPLVVAVRGNEATGDLGRIPVNSVRRVVFEIANTTDATWEIQKVRADCSCVQTVSQPGPLGPHQTGHVGTVFTAPGIAVPYTTRVTLVTDSPKQRLIKLNVKCETYRP